MLGLEMKYSVVLHKEPQSDYSVTVPDLPGCFSVGSTIEEASNCSAIFNKN
jgi:predicted RNase H-like HicB family nuclease